VVMINVRETTWLLVIPWRLMTHTTLQDTLVILGHNLVILRDVILRLSSLSPTWHPRLGSVKVSQKLLQSIDLLLMLGYLRSLQPSNQVWSNRVNVLDVKKLVKADSLLVWSCRLVQHPANILRHALCRF
jgi:hypothetical protein